MRPDSINATLGGVRRRRKIAVFTAAVCAAMSVALFAVAGALIFEGIFTFSSGIRWGFWIAGCGTAALVAGIVFITRWRAVGTVFTVAEDVESRYPEFRERLAAGIQFEYKGISGSQSLAAAVADEARELLASVNLGPLVNWRPVVRWSVALIIAFCAAVTPFLVSPNTSREALAHLLAPSREFSTGPVVQISVLPGNTRIAKGDTLHVQVQITGSIPSHVQFVSRDVGRSNWIAETIAVEDSSRVVWALPEVRFDTEYRVVAGVMNSGAFGVGRMDVLAESDVYRVQVVERPRVVTFSTIVNYPAYTGLGQDTLPENEGNLTALAGSSVRMELQLNKPVRAGWMHSSRGDSVRLTTSERSGSLTWPVRTDGDYHFELRDEYGYGNADPITYHVRVLRDERPAVRIVLPAREADLSQDMMVGLRVEALDDFGFSRMELHYALPGGRTGVNRLPLTTIARGQAISRSVWDVGDFDLLPEDRITYRVVVFDNDRITGPKRAESEEHTLRFPSAAEVFAEAEERQSRQIVDLTQMTERSRDIQERLDVIRREVLKTQNLSWDSRQEAQRLVEQQQQMNEQIQQLSQELQETVQNLTQHNVLSPETMNRLSQIQDLMSQIVTPELQQAMQRMQQVTQNVVDPERVQQAMQNVQNQREEFNQRLDRILNLLQEAQADQALDAMTRRMQELARIQQNVAEQMQDDATHNLANRERALSAQVNDAQNRLQAMADEMQQLPRSPSDSLNALSERMSSRRISERLRDVGEQLRNGAQPGQMQQEAQDIASDMQQMAEDMERLSQNRRNSRREDVVRKLDRAARNLLRLSMMQESLLGETGQQRDPDGLIALGGTQVDLQQGTAGVAGEVTDASRETVLISRDALAAVGQAINSMQEATSALERRRRGPAKAAQRAAMGSLNRAVAAMRQSRNQASESQSGSGLEQLLEQLANMAERQQQLNQQGEGMPQQGGMGASDMEALLQMAAEQRALGNMMGQLAGQLEGYRQIMGRLDDLQGEMEEAARDLMRGNLGPRLQDRQRRILRRLLDAQRSLQGGQVSRERISETAERYESVDPGRLPDDLGERQVLLREAMLEALRAGYPPEYRDWIRGYYERMMTSQSEE